jgi:hypothetical protein
MASKNVVTPLGLARIIFFSWYAHAGTRKESSSSSGLACARGNHKKQGRKERQKSVVED